MLGVRRVEWAKTGDEGRRLPAYLLVDCSMAMAGAPIASVSRAIGKLIADLSVDRQALKRTWLSVITFGDVAQQLSPLAPLESFRFPEFAPGGRPCLGNALELLKTCIDREVGKGDSLQKADYKPIIFIISSGLSEDDWQTAAEDLARRKITPIFVCAAWPDAERAALDQFAEDVIKVDSSGFDRVELGDFFRRLSMSVVSRSAVETHGLAVDFGTLNTIAQVHGPKSQSAVSIVDQVNFSAFAPTEVEASTTFILDIWAHRADQWAQVLELAQSLNRSSLVGRKGPSLVTSGTVLTVTVDVPGFSTSEPVDVITWAGDASNASFLFAVPPETPKGPHSGKATIAVAGVAITKLMFTISVGNRKAPHIDRLAHREVRPSTAFASYASQDRTEVLARVQGMQKANPCLDVFLDVLSLRSGQDWEQHLSYLILTRDVFFLFWSRNAANSAWVEREWRLALEKRGIEYIDPVPLEDPETAPPPKPLSSLHFNDSYLAYIQGSKALDRIRIPQLPAPPPRIEGVP